MYLKPCQARLRWSVLRKQLTAFTTNEHFLFYRKFPSLSYNLNTDSLIDEDVKVALKSLRKHFLKLNEEFFKNF